MNLNELSREQLLLLNTDFGSELEKQAEAIVNEEMSKVAELQEQANELYAYGAELAMQKIAEMEENYKHEEEESKEKEEGEEEEKKEEEEKTAAGTGSFILQGFWNTLMEKGAEYYGDQNIYLEELVKQTGFDKIAMAVDKAIKGVAKGAKKGAKKGATKEAPGFIDRTVSGTKGMYNAGKGYFGATSKKGKEKATASFLRNAKKAGPGLALGAAGAGTTGYVAHRALKD